MTLGCSRWQAFYSVAVPSARRGMVAAFSVAWARSLGEFGPVLVFAGATRMKTEVLPTTVWLELSVGNLEAAVAVSLLLVVLALIVLVVIRMAGEAGQERGNACRGSHDRCREHFVERRRVPTEGDFIRDSDRVLRCADGADRIGKVVAGRTDLRPAAPGGGTHHHWRPRRDARATRPAARGYVPQDGALFPTMTVREQIGFAPRRQGMPRTEREALVGELAEGVGVAHLLERKPRGLVRRRTPAHRTGPRAGRASVRAAAG